MTALRAVLVSGSLLAATAFAAEPPPASPPPAAAPQAAAPPANPAEPAGDRVGLGAGIGSGGTAILLVPFDLGATRVELEGAYAKSGTSDLEVSASHLGLGVLGLWAAAPAVRGSAGARVQWERASAGSVTSDAVRVAAALGAEWVPTPAVSLGVEGQAGYAFAAGGSAVGAFDVSAQAVLRVFLSSSGAGRAGSEAGKAQGGPGGAPVAPKRCASTWDCDGRDLCLDGVCRHTTSR